MSSHQRLARALLLAMIDLVRRAKRDANYPGGVFQSLVSQGNAVAAAKRLINAPRPGEGFQVLWRLGRLDLTVEALVVESSRWHPLFTAEELDRARGRLCQCGYVIREHQEE